MNQSRLSAIYLTKVLPGLKPVIGKIEDILYDMINYQKINYLMLMMVDNDVHFPRHPSLRWHQRIRGGY